MAEAFPDISETFIKLIVTLPYLLMIFASLLAGYIKRIFHQRTQILTGLFLFLIGGLGAGCVDSVRQILFCRIILGIGAGLVLPFSTGLIGACYSGQMKTKMMGYSSAVNAFGIIICSSAAGLLAVASWKYVFNIYWIAAPAMLLCWAYLRIFPGRSDRKTPGKLPQSVYLYSFIALILMMIFFLFVTNLPFIIQQRRIGGPDTSGYLFAVNSAFILAGGIALSWLMKLKKYFPPLAVVVLALSFYFLAETWSLCGMIIISAVCGFAYGALFPYFLNMITKDVASVLSMKSMSVGMAFVLLGQFISPLLTGAASLFGLGAADVFRIVAVIMLITALVKLITGLTRNKKA
jgi:MFS family permease